MAESFRRATSGDPFRMPAGTYNAFVDAAVANKKSRDLGSSGSGGKLPEGLILTRNDSGADVGQFKVLGIDDIVFDPADDLDTFKNTWAISGVTPTSADHTGYFVITNEPIKSGAIGR